MATDLNETGLPVRVIMSLWGANIRTFEELSGVYYQDWRRLLRIQGIGSKSMRHIRELFEGPEKPVIPRVEVVEFDNLDPFELKYWLLWALRRTAAQGYTGERAIAALQGYMQGHGTGVICEYLDQLREF